MKTLAYFCYRYFAMKLPRQGRLDLGSQKLRNYLVRKYLTSSGKNISINKNVIIESNVYIGHNSGISENCLISGPSYIGNDVIIGPETFIYTTNHGFLRKDIPIWKQPKTPPRPVVIGNDVWIGSRTTILPGVKIGDGAIIGASSVVTKDVQPYTIVAGNPATVIRKR
jgi:maltose O-acetyltransferase